ncbi:cysteine hydrolase family protein [soil metagenome]
MTTNQVLLIIDTQVAMVETDPAPHNLEVFLAAVKDVLGRARASKTPVVFVQHISADYEPMTPGHPEFETHPDIAPMPGEPIVHKRACDSFYQTDLEEELKKLGAETLVVTGMQTEQCIDTTCRSAMSHGYDVVLVSDGHTTWDSNGLTAAQIIAHANTTLSDLAHPDKNIVVATAADIEFESFATSR